MRRFCIPCSILLALSGWAEASSPVLTRITPPVAQRGTEVDVVVEGQRLGDAQELMFYTPGIAVTHLEAIKQGKLADKAIKAHLKVLPDASLGEHALRVRTSSGISDLKTFQVTPYPIVEEKEPNSDFKTPQKVPLNVTVSGVIASEDVDYFQVELKKGERLTAEVVGMRMGEGPFDPYIAILDTKRFELASSDDTTLLLQDPYISIIAPADGQYIIQVRDSSYAGNGKDNYLLHVGHFPRPAMVTPVGAKAGQEVTLTFLGDPTGPIQQKIKLPNKPEAKLPVYCEQNGLLAPSPNYLRVEEFGAVEEAEPNNDPKHATPCDLEAPFALAGAIAQADDEDYFRFKGKKGQVLDVRVHARDLRSPLDSILSVTDPKGKQLGYNDDAGSPDSYLRVNIPADGEYLLRVRDQLRGGSPLHLYRVEVTPAEPSLSLTLVPVNQNSQERNAIAIPRGSFMGAVFRAKRENFGGELKLLAENLPKGVTMHVGPIVANSDQVPVLFEARADAPLEGKLVELKAQSIDPKKPAQADFEQEVELVKGPNNTAYYSAQVDRFALAVAEELPFSVQLEAPKGAIPQNGLLGLKVKVERRGDFKGQVAVRLLHAPSGISASTSLTIPPNKTDGMLMLSASETTPRKEQLSLLGTADVHGPAYACSAPVELEIAPAYVKGKLIASSVEQGKSVKITCTLDQKTPFSGKAKAKLKGLPANVTADDVEFTSSDKEISFNVTTTAKSPATQHKSLYVQATIQKEGEPITQNLAQGGILRIDALPKAHPKVAANTAKKGDK